VGIGTSSPSRELEVSGTGNVYIKATAVGATDSAGLELDNAGVVWLIQNDDTSSDALTFDRAGTERMRIDATGNVGIGVVPSAWRSNEASIDIGRYSTSTSVGNYSNGGSLLAYNTFINTSGQFTRKATGFSTTYNTLNGVHEWTSDASAAVGAFTPTPRMTLDASGDLILGSTASLGGATITTVSSGNAHNAMRNSAATAGKFWRQEVDSANIFYILNDATTGVYMSDGGTTWVAISDETVKENIVEIEGALDKVMDYRCVEYNLIADENKAKKIGFIAQDWEVDYSPVVVTGADGKLGMQYTETIPVLLKAIQEQQAIIEALTARIEALES
jgi:hypothetical protein